MMVTTKEELLKYFAGLDISTLQKLQKYSKLLIIPDEDLLTNATMAQMVDKAHNLADSLFPEWTDRSKSDFGEFLIEIFAIFSEKDFWYINAFANEGILRKMRSYSNAFSKASCLGYKPTLCEGSVGNFMVTFKKGENITYEKGDLVVDVDGVSFTNDSPFVVPQSVDDKVMQMFLHEGKQIAEDTTYNGYSIFIKKGNVDVYSISVIIEGIRYNRVPNFAESQKDSTHFMVLPEENGSCSIHFGSNGFGVQPSIGKSVRIEYRICNGKKGNIPKSEAKVKESLSERAAVKVELQSDCLGGSYAESLTSIKENAANAFSIGNAAINEHTTEELIERYPFVHRAKVEVLGREVSYRVIPSSGYLEITDGQVSEINRRLQEALVFGYNAVYAPNNYVDLVTSADMDAKAIIVEVISSYGYDRSVIEDSVRQVMEDLTNPLVSAEYGGSFVKANTDILMRSRTQGIQSVVFKILKDNNEESLMKDFSLSPTEIFRKINQNDLIVRINVI